MGQKADFVGTFTVDTDAKRDAILAAANNRGQQCFNAIAPYGATTTTPPLTLATMKQAYTLNEAAVEVVPAKTGARGNEYLTALDVQTGGATTQGPEIGQLTADPNNYTATGGPWPGGTQIYCDLTLTDPDGQSEGDTFTVTLPPGSHSDSVAASVVCAAIDELVHYRCTQVGSSITITAAAAGNTVTSNLYKV